MKLRELSIAEFRQFAASCPTRHYYQSVEMYQRYQKKGTEAYLLGLVEGKKIMAAGLFFARPWRFGQKIFECLRGYLMDYESEGAEEIFGEMTRTVKKFLRDKGGMLLLITPNLSHVVATEKNGQIKPEDTYQGIWRSGDRVRLMREKGAVLDWAQRLGYKVVGEYGMTKWMYVKELPAKTEEILKSYRERHRHTTRYATERYGVKLRKLEPAEMGIFEKIVEQTGERRGFKTRGLEYYQELLAAFPGQIECVVAEIEENGKRVPIAVAMMMYADNEVAYLYSGSVAEYKRLGGPHLIQYEAMKKAVERGTRRYNFYGMTPVPGDGVYEFKRGFGGELEESVGALALPLSGLGRAIMALKYPYKAMQTVS